MAKYHDNKAIHVFYKTDKTLPLYRSVNGKIVSAGNLPAGKIFRLYKGVVQSPWGKVWTTSPSGGYFAIETAPYLKGQHWAGYVDNPLLVLPSVEAQVADKSSKNRRVWAKEVDIEASANPLAKSETVSAEGMGASLKPGGSAGTSKDPTKPKKPGDVKKPDDEKEGGSNWIWFLLAGGAMVAGAPVVVPLGLAVVGIATAKEKV